MITQGGFTKRLLFLYGVLCVTFVAACTTIERDAGEPLPIIDMHMHVYAPDDYKEVIPLPGTRRIDESVKDYESHLTRTLEEMEKYNIVKAMVSGPLDSLEPWRTAASARFIVSPAFPHIGNIAPYYPDLARLRTLYEKDFLGGMGEISSQYAGLSPNDPVLEPYFALAEEMDVPVLIHTLGIGARRPNFRSSSGHPLLLEEVLVRHPKLRLYLENAGYPFLDEMLALMYQYPQVYADLSTITWLIPREAFHDHLRGLVRAGFGKRLMFGSDHMRWPETIGMAIEGIEAADFLTEDQKRDIFYNNAARFLRLDQEGDSG